GERSIDVLEGLKLLEAADVSFRGFDGSAPGGSSADGDVGLLLGDRVGLEEVLVALCGAVGEREVGLRALEVGFGDLELLVHLRGFDDGHELALSDVLSDVDEKLLEIAIGARIDGCVIEGLSVTGKSDLAS